MSSFKVGDTVIIKCGYNDIGRGIIKARQPRSATVEYGFNGCAGIGNFMLRDLKTVKKTVKKKG
jgi:hypothetical protein